MSGQSLNFHATLISQWSSCANSVHNILCLSHTHVQICMSYLLLLLIVSHSFFPLSPTNCINQYIRYGTRCSSSQSKVGAHSAIDALAISEKKIGEEGADALVAVIEPGIRRPQLGACSMDNIPHGLFVSGLKKGVSECTSYNFIHLTVYIINLKWNL